MATDRLSNSIVRWRADPVTFVEQVLIDPESGKPFNLYAQEKAFLRHGLELTADGKMRFTELCYSAPKKAGKTGLAAMIVICTAVVLAGVGGEINLLANDLEQSTSRVFRAVAGILGASPLLRDAVDITANRVVFRSTGTIISALASDYEGFSGGNPTLNVYDELAYYTSESARRLWDEGVPSPARKISFRLSVSTAGFDGEPSPLRDLYDRAMEHGVEIAPDLRVHENALVYWTHEMRAPWQTTAWVEEMRRTYARRPNQFRRLILNQWVSAESAAIDLQQWDRCTDPELRPVLANSGMPVWAALDLGLKHDSTALVAVGWDGDRIRLVTHQIFTARPGETLDVEATAEAAIISLRSRFALREVRYDPWQAISLAQRLSRRGVIMTEFPQSLPNLSLMASNLIDVLRTVTLLLYPNDELRQAAGKTIMIESARGMRLGKAKASDRVDPIVALAMACLAAVQEAGTVLTDADRAFAQRAAREIANARRREIPDRLYANGRDICDAEDRLTGCGRGSRYGRGRGF